MDWLLQNHRELIDAEFALNPDSGGIVHGPRQGSDGGIRSHGKTVRATSRVLATNPGGHSSLPTPDNAIYHVADALSALEKSPFPFELNTVTREYFGQMALIETGQTAADLRAILGAAPDPAAIARLSKDARYNSTMRTTCVATMLSGGHAPNALPQSAEANVNCRIFPGHSQEDIRLELIHLFNDPKLTVRYRTDAGDLADHGSDRKAMVPPPLRADVHEIAACRIRKAVAGSTGDTDHDDGIIGQHLHHERGHTELWDQWCRDRQGRYAHARQGRTGEGGLVLHGRGILL